MGQDKRMKPNVIDVNAMRGPGIRRQRDMGTGTGQALVPVTGLRARLSTLRLVDVDVRDSRVDADGPDDCSPGLRAILQGVWIGRQNTDHDKQDCDQTRRPSPQRHTIGLTGS